MFSRERGTSISRIQVGGWRTCLVLLSYGPLRAKKWHHRLWNQIPHQLLGNILFVRRVLSEGPVAVAAASVLYSRVGDGLIDGDYCV